MLFLQLTTIQLLKMSSICTECGAIVASMPHHMKIHDRREFECEVCGQICVQKLMIQENQQMAEEGGYQVS